MTTRNTNLPFAQYMEMVQAAQASAIKPSKSDITAERLAAWESDRKARLDAIKALPAPTATDKSGKPIKGVASTLPQASAAGKCAVVRPANIVDFQAAVYDLARGKVAVLVIDPRDLNVKIAKRTDDGAVKQVSAKTRDLCLMAGVLGVTYQAIDMAAKVTVWDARIMGFKAQGDTFATQEKSYHVIHDGELIVFVPDMRK